MEEVTETCSFMPTNANTVTHQLCHADILENVVNDAGPSIGATNGAMPLDRRKRQNTQEVKAKEPVFTNIIQQLIQMKKCISMRLFKSLAKVIAHLWKKKSQPRSSLDTHMNAPDTREQCQLMPTECSTNNNNIPEESTNGRRSLN